MNKIMKWVPNMESVIKNHNAGKCPFCDSTDTDFAVVQIVKNLGYCAIWCNDCKQGVHISKMNVNDDMLKDVPIPQDVKF